MNQPPLPPTTPQDALYAEQAFIAELSELIDRWSPTLDPLSSALARQAEDPDNEPDPLDTARLQRARNQGMGVHGWVLCLELGGFMDESLDGYTRRIASANITGPHVIGILTLAAGA